MINGDGTIIESGSNSAFDSFRRGFKIRDGKLVEVDGGWEDSLMDIRLERFPPLARPEGLCGGYTSQREVTDEEMAMFRSLTGDTDIAYTPLSVSTQVVAGTNYMFCCRFEALSDSIRRRGRERQ